MFEEKVNTRMDTWTDRRPDKRTTGKGPWHKLAGLQPVELINKDRNKSTYTDMNFYQPFPKRQISNSSKLKDLQTNISNMKKMAETSPNR